MNKKDVLKKIEEKTGYSEEKCILINEIIEEHFIIGRKNKEKIIKDLKEKIKLSDEESEKTYNDVMEIISTGIKEKIKHPFNK